MEPDDLSVLAQRAASEGPRWTRAVEDQSAPIPREKRASLEGTCISFDAGSLTNHGHYTKQCEQASLEGSFIAQYTID
jgi:hypothetical protein